MFPPPLAPFDVHLIGLDPKNAEVAAKADALDADLAAATKTGVFKKAFPERHFDCGIAEQNMIGVAAGLARAGKSHCLRLFPLRLRALF